MAEKKKKSKSNSVVRYGQREPRSITVEKAANGYVITTHTGDGRSVEVARNMVEVGKIQKRILEG